MQTPQNNREILNSISLRNGGQWGKGSKLEPVIDYYLFAFEAPIAKMDKRCGMFRCLDQSGLSKSSNAHI